MYETLYTAILDALRSLGAGDISFALERPGSFEHGDYATNAALVAGKVLGKSPREVADDLAAALRAAAIPGVSAIEIAGPGFINLSLSVTEVRSLVSSATDAAVFTKGAHVAEPKTYLVEYTDPNPFKEFHIGHLMSNATGEAVARLLEATGNIVRRANYQGDVGPHVAKCLFGLREKNITEPTLPDMAAAYVEGARRYEENPEDKAAIDALNKEVYARTNPELNALYEQGRTLSLEHFENIYKTLGTKFDHYFFESVAAPRGRTVVEAHPNIFVQSEGAVVYHPENPKLHTRVFITGHGTPTYECKEIGLAEMKREAAKFDTSITITANEQDEFFKVVYEALDKVHPEWAGTSVHHSHGMMRITGGKMSSRLGNVITGESLIRDLTAVALEKMQGRVVAAPEQIAQDIAVGAIKYAVLRQGSGKDIVFNPEQSLSFEGDSGPYLQYSLVRARSLLRAGVEKGVAVDSSDAPEHAHLLERLLIHYPDLLARAATELEPHLLTTYLTELAGVFNAWYANGKVLGGAHEHYGLLLATAFARTLEHGLQTLGIPAPEEM